MTILDNSLLQLFTVLLFLAALGFLLYSYVKRNYQKAAYGLLISLLGFILVLFLAILKKDIFVLSDEVDYGANYIFTLSILATGIVSITGLLTFNRHRVIPQVFIQLSILFVSSLILTTLGGSVYQAVVNQRLQAKKGNQGQFIKAEDFRKGDADPEWSEAGNKPDSVIKQ
jgi:hypothetical protein